MLDAKQTTPSSVLERVWLRENSPGGGVGVILIGALGAQL